MRQRSTAINIRVTDGEKRKMETAAKKCGLSLSAYLRKLGLGKDVQATLLPCKHESSLISLLLLFPKKSFDFSGTPVIAKSYPIRTVIQF